MSSRSILYGVSGKKETESTCLAASRLFLCLVLFFLCDICFDSGQKIL